MKLYLDTTSRADQFLALDRTQYPITTSVLATLAQALGERTPQDITEIAVNTGPGSFTGIKVGVSIANALGYALGIFSVSDLVQPEYGKSPNITPLSRRVPKKSS